MNDIGKALAALRHAKGMTQKELASAVRLSEVMIASIETGRREPSWLTLRRICIVLGVTVEVRFKRKDGGK